MIEVSCVSKSYGKNLVLDRVSVLARDGVITGFVGPNGAGKTTVMRIVMGLAKPDSGTAVFDGAAFAGSRVPLMIAGALITSESLPPRLTCLELLDYACRTNGIARKRAAELLALVGLAEVERKPIGAYSLGMRQRLGMALALMGDPRNLVLDEPVNGLDPDGVRWLRDLLIGLADQGKAILLSSHMMAELSLLAHSVVIINKGQVVRGGTVEELAGEAVSSVYAESADRDQLLVLFRSLGWAADADGERGLVVRGVAPDDVGRVVYSNGFGLSHLSVRNPSLEDLYMTWTRVSPPNTEGVP